MFSAAAVTGTPGFSGNSEQTTTGASCHCSGK
jgi:hypothetical protein